jgi:uncharacterized protein (TIGR00369 family)
MTDLEGSRLSGMWANLGARLTSQEEGRARVEACLTAERHGFSSGGRPFVHGGALAALADMAVASAAMSAAHPDRVVVTVDLRVEYLRSASPGTLIADADVRRRTNRLCFAHAAVRQEDGTLVVEARSVLAYVRPPDAETSS